MSETLQVELPAVDAPERTTSLITAEILAEMKRVGIPDFDYNRRCKRGGKKGEQLRALCEELLDDESVYDHTNDMEVLGIIADTDGGTVKVYGSVTMNATLDLTDSTEPGVVVWNEEGFEVEY